MRDRSRRKDQRDTADTGAECPPLPADPKDPHKPAPAFPGQDDGATCSIYDSEKVYLGVRVKMPVRDLLRNIRLARGWQPEAQETFGNSAKGQRKRVKSHSASRTVKVRSEIWNAVTPLSCATKSLEELAIIVEVLEEDLKTGTNFSSPLQPRSSSHLPLSPQWSPPGYNSDECDEMIPSPEAYLTCSPGAAEYHQVPSPPHYMFSSPQLYNIRNENRDGGQSEVWLEPPNPEWDLNGSAFFLTQLQKEEINLRGISDAVLLNTDGHGQTALHHMACIGKRALGYCIAQRMAALNCLDLRDSAGMTALLHAAKHNQHLMVADLIRLGANVNMRNKLGKTCLHLSAEKGYIRVLEVLKQAMIDGVYVDVEAADNFGMSVLQCASVAMKATVRELKSSKSPSETRLHTLRQEQMMETLECLLQMGSYLHTMGSWRMQPTIG